MFVPEPVISLAIRPKGQETPNFSRALNRFQKEDPTFRVHVDAESQEVRSILLAEPSFLAHSPSRSPRPSSPVWESSISTSTSSA
jgi:hypothetical protein